MDTIAICLVIVDELHHEEIWKWWLGEDLETRKDGSLLDRSINSHEKELPASSSSSYSCSPLHPHPSDPSHSLSNGKVNKGTYKARLFIHAKYPERIKSPWVRARTLGKRLIVFLLYFQYHLYFYPYLKCLTVNYFILFCSILFCFIL